MTNQQEQIPPAQNKAGGIPALQTPLNEERNKKRDRQATPPTGGPAEQPGSKRQRLNPPSEDEIIEETADDQRT